MRLKAVGFLCVALMTMGCAALNASADETASVQLGLEQKAYFDAAIDKKFDQQVACFKDLATAHISFLTDKISFLSILLTFISTLFGLAGVGVTVFAGYKVSVWRSEMRDLHDEFDTATKNWNERERKLKVDLLRAYGFRIRDASLQYKALNVTTFPGSWAVAMTTMRQSLLNTLLDSFREALSVARDLGRPSDVVRLLARMASIEAELKNANGPSDAQFIKDHRKEIKKPCESAELEKFLADEKVNPATLKWYLQSFDDFYGRFI